MTAETIAKTLGGRRVGTGWIARCPAHEDRKPSFSITETKGGKVLVRCHAGCNQGRVIAVLRSRGLWEKDSGGNKSSPTTSRTSGIASAIARRIAPCKLR
jgi:hypothetical protein